MYTLKKHLSIRCRVFFGKTMRTWHMARNSACARTARCKIIHQQLTKVPRVGLWFLEIGCFLPRNGWVMRKGTVAAPTTK